MNEVVATRAPRPVRHVEVPAIPMTDGMTETAVRLMEAAADAFADKGFHATTTRDIAGRAGLSPAGVYVHFASKEEVLFAICERGHTAARDLLVEAAQIGPTPTDAISGIMVNFSRWHAEHHRVGRIIQYEFGHLSAAHREALMGLRREIDAVIRSVLTDGVQRGEFVVEDVPDTAVALLSLCVDVARWYQPGSRRTPQQVGETTGRHGLRLLGVR